MARRSAAALSIAGPTVARTLPPPKGLTKREKDLWVEIVATKPADWFAEDTAPVLKEYVRAAAMCDALDARVRRALKSKGDTGELSAVVAMRDKEARRMVTMATKLRLTQQSQYTPQAAATANKQAGGKRPWQA